MTVVVYHPRFAVGQRVSRPEDVFDRKSRVMSGTVTARYAERTRFGYYPELYAVLWDGQEEERRGYLPHGLDALIEASVYPRSNDD